MGPRADEFQDLSLCIMSFGLKGHQELGDSSLYGILYLI